MATVFTICGKPWEKVSPILVTLTSPVILISNVRTSASENKPDGVNPNSNDIDFYVRKNERNILWFLADCLTLSGPAFSVVHQARGGGGGLRGPDAKNQG